MELVHKDAQSITIRFDKKDLSKIVEPLVKKRRKFCQRYSRHGLSAGRARLSDRRSLPATPARF
jgi:hypothetical protein